jgi:hypothetical protein
MDHLHGATLGITWVALALGALSVGVGTWGLIGRPEVLQTRWPSGAWTPFLLAYSF